MEMIKLLDGLLIAKFEVRLKYCLLVCENCGRSWGVNVENNELRKDQLVCQRCATEKVAEEIQ